MERGFLEEIGVRRNAVLGSVLGLVLGALYFYSKYQIREQLNYPIYLDFGLGIVLAVGVALFVTIVLSLGKWLAWGLREAEDDPNTRKPEKTDEDET